MKFFVERYASDGSWVDPEVDEHETLEDALADVSDRLGRQVDKEPDWHPDKDMHGPNVPDDTHPYGAWSENDEELCGGVAVWIRR